MDYLFNDCLLGWYCLIVVWLVVFVFRCFVVCFSCFDFICGFCLFLWVDSVGLDLFLCWWFA